MNQSRPLCRAFVLRRTVYVGTALALLLTVLFLFCFVRLAPGCYPVEGAGGVMLIDRLFAGLLLADLFGAALSLITAAVSLYPAVRRREWGLRQTGELLLGLYPAVLLGSLCGWEPSVFASFFLAPFRILFG